MSMDSGNGRGGSDGRRRDLPDPFASGRKPRQPRPTVPPPQGAPPPPAPPARSDDTASVPVVESTVPPEEALAEEVAAEPTGGELAIDEPDEVVEVVPGDIRDGDDESAAEFISDEDLELLKGAEHDLVAEYRDRAARAEAELANFRRRVERDRQANREVVIAEVIRSLLPVIDDLDRADAHGDLEEGSPLAIIAQKLRASIERHGVKRVGEPGEAFDPKLHEALMQRPSSEVSVETIAAVIESGYQLGDRLIRPAKVAVEVPE